ncbi:MAG: aminotransferase class V-fold PLP-dependent enzyme [Clostridia bacterium]|jgi:hypothetical protein|nr:aminotransferase class V-fold PLP-dependent enzyme [Clostridia bacterium]
MGYKYKFQMYRDLLAKIPQIYAEAEQSGKEIGIPKELYGKFGLTGAISGCPAPLRKDIMEASEKGAKEVIPLAKLVDEIREIVKDVYGDEWDAAPVNTCEAGLWVTFDSLFTPPALGRGDNYRARYIAPLEKHMHHQAGYGRPFPAKYKDFIADRGSTPGELGFYGKRQNNLDTVIVPLAGARYEIHGIKQWPVPMLTEVDPEGSKKNLEKHADIHKTMLTGFTSMCYPSPGYGYAAQDNEGTPVMLKNIAQIAQSYNVPYVIDNAWGLPFVGVNPVKVGCDAMIFSMDKATGSATSGLVIGRDDIMVSIRRAMGMHGDRYGTTASYGKAAYVAFDPGKEALLTQIQALKVLRDKPEVLTKPVDDLYNIIVEEFKGLISRFPGIKITKVYNSTAVEINYEGTWKDGKMGIPIFSIEDMYAGTNIFQVGMNKFGVIPTIAYDGNIYVSTGLATTDEDGNLIPEAARYAIKALVSLIEITCKAVGI